MKLDSKTNCVSETEMNWKCGDEECIYCGDEESVYQEKTWKKKKISNQTY